MSQPVSASSSPLDDQTVNQSATLLLVIRHSPYTSQVTREALDAALTAAAFEVPLSLLFINDGCYTLLSNQQPEQLQVKNLSKTLPALAMYDIDRAYSSASCLQQRGIDSSQCVLDPELLDDAAIAQLFRQHQHVLSF